MIAYPVAIETLKDNEIIAQETKSRQVKYLNNIVEQYYRNIKRITRPMMGFKSFNSARRTLRGIEAINMIRKSNVSNTDYSSLKILASELVEPIDWTTLEPE